MEVFVPINPIHQMQQIATDCIALKQPWPNRHQMAKQINLSDSCFHAQSPNSSLLKSEYLRLEAILNGEKDEPVFNESTVKQWKHRKKRSDKKAGAKSVESQRHNSEGVKQCPSCGTGLAIKESRPHADGSVHRRRACPQCDYRITTVEQPLNATLTDYVQSLESENDALLTILGRRIEAIDEEIARTQAIKNDAEERLKALQFVRDRVAPKVIQLKSNAG